MNLRRHALRGFSLIELLIVMAVIGLLAAVAYPAYTDHVLRTHRARAAACLSELGLHMERRFTTSMTYDGTPTLPAIGCVSDNAARYGFAFAASQPTSTTWQVNATPANAQAGDTRCATLSLDEKGLQAVSGTADVQSCWR